MAVHSIKPKANYFQPNNTLDPFGNHDKNDPFRQALQRAESQLGGQYESLSGMYQRDPLDYIHSLSSGTQGDSSGKGVEQHLEIIKSLARMQLMSLNQTLIEAFSGSTGANHNLQLGMGSPLLSAMAGVLQTVKNMQEIRNVEYRPQINRSIRVDIPEVPFVPETVEVEKEAPEVTRTLTEESQETDTETEEPSETKVSKAQPVDREIDSIVKEAAQKYGLDPNLVRAVIKTESNFDPKAVSSAGAMGLMQLMPKTAEGLGVGDAFDPAQNIDGGARYLKQMLDRYDGEIDNALAAYNWGPGNLDRSRGRYMPRETSNYIRIVNKHLRRYTALEKV
jgi:hypothetical protein